MMAFATASAAASSTASAECMYRLVMLCVLWPSKGAIVGSLIGCLIVAMTVGVYAAKAVAEPRNGC